MKVNLSNKVAIVTGAARGIGKACAQKLLENGAKVVIADLREEEGQATVKELSKFGPCSFISVNITSEASIQGLVDGTLKQFGRIDILINNAGVNVTGNPADRTDIDKFTTENWHKLIEVNLTGTFLCSRAVSRVMIELPGPWLSDVRSCDIEDMKKALVQALGPDVNLANVPPASIIDTEATRTGLGTAGPLKPA